jgi:acetolactate synthase-1/2/3 large subunit
MGVVANGDLAVKQLYKDVSARIRKARNRIPDRNIKLNLNNSDRIDAAASPMRSVIESPTVEDVISRINSVLTPEDIVVLEAVTNNPIVLQSLERLEPGNVCFSGGPGLGWALGASVGVKLASSQRRVVAVVGDGAFMFGVPTSALCLAAEARAPFVTVVLNNGGYRASRLPVYELFPNGASARAEEVIGTQFIQPPDFSAVARACGAYGRRVDTLSDLLPALQEAFSVLDRGCCAVVDVHLEFGG